MLPTQSGRGHGSMAHRGPSIRSYLYWAIATYEYFITSLQALKLSIKVRPCLSIGDGGAKQDGRDESATPNSKLIASFYHFIIIMSGFSSCKYHLYND